MSVEIVKDPACTCYGCDADRKTKALIDEAGAALQQEAERIKALPYHSEEAVERARRRHLARTDAIVRAMMPHLVGCLRLRIVITGATP